MARTRQTGIARFYQSLPRQSRLKGMTPEEQAELEINVAADPDNGPIYIAAVDRVGRQERASEWPGVVAVIVVAALICWLILRI